VTDTTPITPARRIALAWLVMIATMMQVLDSSIANVALPHMQAALNANLESVAWVLTSYILASAVATPVTGSIETLIGRRNLFVIAVAGFTLASMMCGAAPTLPAMVTSRVLQGLFGAMLMPLSQAVLLDIYPPEGRAKAITIWSIGTMIGPIFGPVVGGWLTESFNWRWIFYINVPIGIVCTAGLWLLLDPARAIARKFDVAGFAYLATGLAAMQLMLDRGTQKDWFDSTEILIELALTIGAFWMFTIHTLTARDPLIPRALLTNRNFMSAGLVGLIVSGVMYASQALMAPMLQQLLRYNTEQAGMLMMPRGLATMIAMMVAGPLTARIDARWVMGSGLVAMIIGQFIMSGFDIMMDSQPVIIAGIFQGAGIGLVAIPMMIVGFGTLPPLLRTDAAAIFSLVRNVSGSVGIAICTALVARNYQVSHAELGGHVTQQSMPMLDDRLIHALGRAGGTVAAMVDAEVNRQALMIAYINDYWIMMWGAILMLPMVLLLRPARVHPNAQPVALE